MTITGDTVQDDPGEGQLRIKKFEAEHDCGDAPSALAGVDHKYHGKLKKFCDFRAATRFRGAILAIKEPHHAFCENRVRALSGLAEDVFVCCEAEHPGVEVTCGPARDTGVVAGVKKVGTAFEGLYDQSPAAHRCKKRER